MTTQRFTLLAAVALAATLTACSATAADDPSITATTGVTATPSTTAVPATTAGVTSESEPQEPATTSSISDLGPTSDAPGTTQSPVAEFGLTGQDLVDAEAAWDVYKEFRVFYRQARADPGADWSVQLMALSNDPIRTNTQTALTNQAILQTKVDDLTTTEIVNVAVKPDFVVLAACIDSTQTEIVDKDGNDVKAPDAAGSYYRHPGEIWVERQGGVWLYVDQKNDFQSQC